MHIHFQIVSAATKAMYPIPPPSPGLILLKLTCQPSVQGTKPLSVACLQIIIPYDNLKIEAYVFGGGGLILIHKDRWKWKFGYLLSCLQYVTETLDVMLPPCHSPEPK